MAYLIPVPRYRKWIWHHCSSCPGRIADGQERHRADGSYERTTVCLACGTTETYRVW